MARRRLTLVPAAPPHRLRRGAATAWLLALVGASALGVRLGSERERDPTDPRDVAEEALSVALEAGLDAEPVRRTLHDLRSRVAAAPLDWRARLAYSSLLLGLATHVEETAAAAFHARRAASLAPVTVPAVRTAALILARTGDTGDALGLVRPMFAYDPGAAAELLLRLEPFVPQARLGRGLAETPGAWHAWAVHLARAGRSAEAHAVIERVVARWPEHRPALDWAILGRLRRGDDEAARALLPPEPELSASTDPGDAPLLVLRALLAVHDAEPAAARADLSRALALDGGSGAVLLRAGEAHALLGDHDKARHLWRRALYGLAPDDTTTRPTVLAHLARLEDRHGRPATALRLWRELEALEPDHVEARRRIDDLTGFRR